MLSASSNHCLTRVGPDDPMGRLLRRYWLPFALADDPAPGGDPKGVELLNERFVAWRDAAGRPGLFAEGCLHRGASMLLARAEDDGLRCIYHGWKFAVDGTVLDTPNVADAAFKQRIKGRSFPVREAGGLLWAYLGPREHEPVFPRWPWMEMPASQRLATRHVEECNFVQVIEGLVDSSHLGLLHLNGLRASDGESGSKDGLGFAQKINSMQRNLAPRQEVQETEFGFFYAALREQAAGTNENANAVGRTEARIAAYVVPCTVFNPNGDIATIVVPASDTRSAFFHVFWSEKDPIGAEPLRSRHLSFIGLNAAKLTEFGLTDATIGRPGTPGPANNFHQDRAGMRAGGTFSGLPGLIEEDVAISVASGAIRDRSSEVLCTSDIGVASLARSLLAAADALEQGRPLPGQRGDLDWAAVGGTHGVLQQRAEGAPWRALLPKAKGQREAAHA